MEALSQGDKVYDRKKVTDKLKEVWLAIPMWLADIGGAIVKAGARLMLTTQQVQSSRFLRKKDTDK